MKHHSNKAEETTTRLIVIKLCNLELKKENVKKKKAARVKTTLPSKKQLKTFIQRKKQEAK